MTPNPQPTTFRLGTHTFDRFTYDPDRDVLEVWVHDHSGVAALDGYDSPEGHAPLKNEDGELVGVQFVDVADQLARTGRVAITLDGESAATVVDDARALVAVA